MHMFSPTYYKLIFLQNMVVVFTYLWRDHRRRFAIMDAVIHLVFLSPLVWILKEVGDCCEEKPPQFDCPDNCHPNSCYPFNCSVTYNYCEIYDCSIAKLFSIVYSFAGWLLLIFFSYHMAATCSQIKINKW